MLAKRTKWVMMVSLMLTLSLIIAACSNNNEGGKTNTGQGGQQGNTGTTPASNGEEEKRGSISVTIYDRANMPMEEGSYEENRWTRWINENGPVDVTFVPIPRNKPEEKLNVLFASGSAPDLILEYSAVVRGQLYEQKQLLPLDDLIEQHSTVYKQMLEEYPVLRRMTTRTDGKIYDIAKINGLSVNHMFLIRKDWLDALKLDVPTTVDELYTVMKAFTENDPDRNGEDDTFGITLTGNVGTNVNFMFGLVDIKYTEKDGELVRAWDNYEAAIKFKKKLYDEGIMDKDYLADANGQKAKRDWINGKLGIYVDSPSAGFANYQSLKQNVPEAEVVAVMLPRTEFGQFSPPLNPPVQTPAVVNARTKDPKAVMQYIDFMVSESTVKTLKYGIENEHHRMENGCPVVIDAEKNQKELSWNIDYYSLLGSNHFFQECDKPESQYDMNDPIAQGWVKILNEAMSIYLNPEVPMPGFTHHVYMPSLPDNLITIHESVDMADFEARAIVGGDSYTAEQAAADARNAWERAGGKEIDEWYKNWYAENKDSAIMMKDIYTIQ